MLCNIFFLIALLRSQVDYEHTVEIMYDDGDSKKTTK